MTKREFIKTGFTGSLGLISLSTFAGSRKLLSSGTSGFRMPDLPYSWDALEPFIDSATLKLHYTKHYAEHTDTLNAIIHKKGMQVGKVKELFWNASRYNAPILHHAGGFFNHRLFWRILTPSGQGKPEKEIARAIETQFGSFSKFKKEFSRQAIEYSGSGWAWLILRDNKLQITTTPDNDNPFMNTLPYEQQGKPLLCLDLWEHSYFLKYQDRKKDYVGEFWNFVNWEIVNKRYINS